MTGNQIKGKGFKGALRYNLEKVDKQMAEVIGHSFACVDERTIMNEIQMVRMLRPNLQKFFYHTSINFPPHEDISNALMKQIAHDYLTANGFTQHQFILFRHYDAEHPHMHILVNRIGYDGEVLSDSNDFARSERILRELEKKYNLTAVISSRMAVKRAPTKNELEMVKRTNVPSRKIHLQNVITNIFNTHSTLTCAQFIKALQERGIQPRFNIANTGYVSGISYGFEGTSITGSKLGSSFKWTAVRNRIDYNQERDQAIINKTNIEISNGSALDIKSKIDPSPKIHFPNQGSFYSHSKAGAIIEDLINSDRQLEQSAENVLRLKRKKRRRKGMKR